jgi:hypothetical protein
LTLDEGVNLNFISETWKKFVFVGKSEEKTVNRRYLELCAFSYLANELRSGDLFIPGADAFSDYRHHLLNLEECDLLAEEYLKELKFPRTAEEFVALLKDNLEKWQEKLTNFIRSSRIFL